MSRPGLLFDDAPPAPPRVRQRAQLARGLTAVVLIVLGTRLVTWTGAYCGALVYFRIVHRLDSPMSKHAERLRTQLQDTSSPEYRTYAREIAGLAPLINFDGKHYRSIIEGGYRYKPVGRDAPPAQREQNIAFFPLYPLLCAPLARWLGTHAAMILVSHAAALAAAIVIYLWIRRRVEENTARFAVACVFALPSACYYSLGYAESLTLLTTAVTLWLIDRRAWLPAAAASGVATASRPTAAGVAGVFALAFWLGSRLPRARRAAALGALGTLACAGLLAYGGYLTWRFGSPLVYFTNFHVGWVPESKRSGWLAFLTLTPVWEHVRYFRDAVIGFPAGLVKLANPFAWNLPINLGILFLSLAGLTRVPRSFRPLLWLGPFVFVQSYLASGGAKFGIEPITRYMAVSIPAFVVLAAWAMREWRPAARTVLIATLILLQASWAFHFGLQEWSG